MIGAVKDLSPHDPLTKAANWRFFEEYSNKAIKSAIRERQAVTLAFWDLDKFKARMVSMAREAGPSGAGLRPV
jgi:GGDEF domain-containing protein